MLVICGAFYRTSTPSFLMTALRLVGVLLGLTLALLTGSRGQLLGAVLVFALFIPVAYKVRSIGGFIAMFVGVAFFGIMLIGVAQAFSGAEVASRWTEKNLAEGAGGRLSFAWQLVQAYLQNPAYWFSGLGPGAFNAVVPNPDGGFHYPHNVLVEALGENGILGLGMFITALALCFAWGRKLLALVEDVPELRGALAILAGMTAFAVFLAIKQSSLMGVPTYFAWMIMLAKVAKAELSLATIESAHHDYDQPAEGYETDEHGEPLPAG
jgi:O-antigen ligase